MEELFVYGTLKDPKIQREVLGRSVNGIPDKLEGYKNMKIEIDKEIYPVIIPHKDAEVDGILIQITPEELKILDDYETSVYQRIKVVLKSGKEAWSFVRNKNSEDSLIMKHHEI